LCQNEALSKQLENPLPDLITGDFDSIDKEALDFYETHSQVPIIPTPDQNYTDFTKALLFLSDPEKHLKSVKHPKKLDAVLAYVESGSTSGRPDQVYITFIMGNAIES
jgi:thiamine pyrophosphokinase